MNPPAQPGKKRKLGEILIEAGLIDELQLRSALSEQKKWGGKLGRTLVEMGYLDEESMTLALSRQLGIPLVNLDRAKPPQDVGHWLRVDMAERYGVFPLGGDRQAKLLHLATADPTNVEVLRELEFHTGMRIQPSVAGATSIDRAIRQAYYGEKVTASEATTPGALGVREATFDAQTLIERSGRHAVVEMPPPFGEAPVASEEVLRRLRQLEERTATMEKHAANQVRALRGLFELLVEKGLISREEYLAKVRAPRKE